MVINNQQTITSNSSGTLSLDTHPLCLNPETIRPPILFVLHGPPPGHLKKVREMVKDACRPKVQGGGGAGIRVIFRGCKFQYVSLVIIDEQEELFSYVNYYYSGDLRVYSVLILVNLLVLSPSHFPVLSSFPYRRTSRRCGYPGHQSESERIWCKPAGLNNTLHIFWFQAGKTDNTRMALLWLSNTYPKAPLFGFAFSMSASTMT